MVQFWVVYRFKFFLNLLLNLDKLKSVTLSMGPFMLLKVLFSSLRSFFEFLEINLLRLRKLAKVNVFQLMIQLVI